MSLYRLLKTSPGPTELKEAGDGQGASLQTAQELKFRLKNSFKGREQRENAVPRTNCGWRRGTPGRLPPAPRCLQAPTRLKMSALRPGGAAPAPPHALPAAPSAALRPRPPAPARPRGCSGPASGSPALRSPGGARSGPAPAPAPAPPHPRRQRGAGAGSGSRPFMHIHEAAAPHWPSRAPAASHWLPPTSLSRRAPPPPQR